MQPGWRLGSMHLFCTSNSATVLLADSPGRTYSPTARLRIWKKPWVRQASSCDLHTVPLSLTIIYTADPRFDAYFDSLPKVEYSTCQLGFHLDLEWPYWTTNMAYSENVEYGDAELTGNKMLRARDPRMVAWWDVPTGY